MTVRNLLAAVSAAALMCGGIANAGTVNFDKGWLFTKGDITDAEKPGFSDAGWQKIDVPHDWEISGPFDQAAPAGGAGGWLPTGVVWYRKHFTVPAADAGKHVFVEFDGVMEKSGVWINGMHLDFHPSGYTSFRYELTRFLKPGDNVDFGARRHLAPAGLALVCRRRHLPPCQADHRRATSMSRPGATMSPRRRSSATRGAPGEGSEHRRQPGGHRAQVHLEVTLIGPRCGKPAGDATGAGTDVAAGQDAQPL